MPEKKYQVTLTITAIVAVYLIGFSLAMAFFGNVRDFFYLALGAVALFMFAAITLAMVGAIAHNVYQYTTTRQRAPVEVSTDA